MKWNKYLHFINFYFLRSIVSLIFTRINATIQNRDEENDEKKNNFHPKQWRWFDGLNENGAYIHQFLSTTSFHKIRKFIYLKWMCAWNKLQSLPYLPLHTRGKFQYFKEKIVFAIRYDHDQHMIGIQFGVFSLLF